MGLNVITVDGKVIRELRTYIFRCYACFKTTTNMKKVFCPSCGNKTLKRVSVFVDKDGNKRMFINFKKNISTRGKRVRIINCPALKNNFFKCTAFLMMNPH